MLATNLETCPIINNKIIGLTWIVNTVTGISHLIEKKGFPNISFIRNTLQRVAEICIVQVNFLRLLQP